jgi:hypothetical protein
VTQQQQCMTALARGNALRLGYAEVRREIRSGVLSAADALDDERAAGLRVYDVVASQHRWGHVRTAWLLADVPVSEKRRVRDLTARQKDVLRSLLLAARPRA